MTRTVAFHTRARTIDHLGREQIADCPTALSELWKNAYDAYARNVALHIFDGEPTSAAIVDDGHGMNRDEFATRWLVVGTEAKLSRNEESERDRLGLPLRQSQGEKGIGRLSIAALGPISLILSKRSEFPYVVSYIDWRIFQNPYLVLEDIQIPVEEFDTPEQLSDLLPELLISLETNLISRQVSSERTGQISDAWHQFDDLERKAKKELTSTKILEDLKSISLTDRLLSSWPVWNGSSTCGTALFVFQLNRELSVWVNSSMHQFNQQDAEVDKVKSLLKKTLVGFTDPYSDASVDFDYSVSIHTGDRTQVSISKGQHFDLNNLHELEHVIEGEFDSAGIFTGSIRAFGREIGSNIKIPPVSPPPRKLNESVGPFKFCIGTFEQEKPKSTHPPDQHQKLLEQAENYGGVAVYRDGLRVMPYGRPESDFFEMEERRSRHAGREFWAHRRSFGRVALTRSNNPNLRDKAGREGLIDNRAKRTLRILVIGLLQQTARRYFGTGSTVRNTILPEVEAQNAAIIESDARIKQRRFTVFRDALRQQSPNLSQAVLDAQQVAKELDSMTSVVSGGQLVELAEKVERLSAQRTELRLPPKPSALRNLEDAYRGYRDLYQSYCATVELIHKRWTAANERLESLDSERAAQSALSRHQKFLNDEISRRLRAIEQLLSAESNRIQEQAVTDRGAYYLLAAPIIEELKAGRIQLAATLNELESARERLWLEIIPQYDAYVRSVQQISEKIDLDALAVWNSDQRAELEQRIWQMHELAQLGITVEIVGHELYTLDAEVGRNLRRLPSSIKESDAYRLALAAHESLVHRLRFLEPLALSGPRIRETISGERIYQYIVGFFGSRFEAGRVTFSATKEFRAFKLSDYPSRILPAFINLVNNSLYWVTLTENRPREIKLALIENVVVIADSGCGVDPDDEAHLFELFFTRRINGRGVGLYLCKMTLAAGGHEIFYLRDESKRVLPGANFGLRFKGGSHA